LCFLPVVDTDAGSNRSIRALPSPCPSAPQPAAQEGVGIHDYERNQLRLSCERTKDVRPPSEIQDETQPADVAPLLVELRRPAEAEPFVDAVGRRHPLGGADDHAATAGHPGPLEAFGHQPRPDAAALDTRI